LGDRVGERAFYYIAELTLDVKCDRVRERVLLYIADQAGIVVLNLCMMLTVTGLERVPLYIADQAGIVEPNLHLILSVTGLESVSPGK
jgi:hypothetical protein